MHPDRPQQSALVLVADDEEIMRLVARESLEQAGFEVVEAADGAEALERFTEARPDLVLLDVQMPHLDGFAACRELRSSALAPHTPILMMTGSDDVDSVRRSYEAGATDFVSKPVNWIILAHRIEFMLRASRAGEELRKSRGQLANAQRIARLGYWEWDVDTGYLACSGQMHKILGEPVHGFTGTLADLTTRVHADDRASVFAHFKKLLEAGESEVIEYRLIAADGSERHVEQQAEVATREEGGKARLVTGTLRDVTARKSAEKKIRFLAHYDALTGLPNRRTFLKRLGLAATDHVETGRVGALLFLNLNRFGRVNETFGHSAGDQLLRMVAKRLLRTVRSNGAPDRERAARTGDFVARFGGDEFIVLISDLESGHDAAVAATRVLEMFARPYRLEEHEIFLGASLGISVFPDDGDDAEILVGMAGSAMRHAKEGHGSSYRFYDESMNASALERLSLESALNTAVDNGELELFYQPQVELTTGSIIGVEALVRWNHPQRGLLGPGEFLPLAEQSNLILTIGEWVLETACEQAAAWQQKSGAPLRVAVNLSSRQLLQTDLPAKIAEILKKSGLRPDLLDLEITEGALMQAFEEATECLWRLKALGVRLSLDDFGTGYSSLSRLARFPLDALKIDRSFLQGVPGARDMEAITSAIIGMADSLGLEVIAEGVEEEAQIEYLMGQGCAYCQGFLYCRPQPAHRITAALESGQSRLLPKTDFEPPYDLVTDVTEELAADLAESAADFRAAS